MLGRRSPNAERILATTPGRWSQNDGLANGAAIDCPDRGCVRLHLSTNLCQQARFSAVKGHVITSF